MKGTLKKYGHRSHLKGKTGAISKKARVFYERDEKRLQKKYTPRKVNASLVQ